MINEENNNTPKKLNIWLPFVMSLILVAGMLIGIKLQPAQAPVSVIVNNEGQSGTALGQGKIEELIRYIEAKYVDKVDRDELVQEAIDNILEQLDPHSNYISAEQLKGVNEQLEGNFEGIGIEFLVVDDTLVVISPLEGGPSELAGILAGDKIVEIGDSLIAGVDLGANGVTNLLKGEKDTEVKIGILRSNDSEVKYFNITRGQIPVFSVDAAYMIDEKTGYIKVNRFSATTYEEFMKGVENMVDNKKMEDLVIDLRGNPGGYLQEATNILSQLFQERDKLLVYTEGRQVKRSEYETTGRNFYDLDDIAVLIDEGSASASEIVAGAVQDWDRGVVIGRRSFGKGLVQEQYKLRDGSALRLTVARYFTPSGRLIQKDYDDLDAYNQDVVDRLNHGELYNQDSVHIADTTEFQTAGGRVVYGGGGITPDIFVPFDSTYLQDDYLYLRAEIPSFTFRYFEKNKQRFAESSLEKFQMDFDIDDETFAQFLEYAKKKEVKIPNNIHKLKPYLNQFLKARLAKHLYGDDGFFRVFNQNDEAINQAVQVLKEEKPLVEK